MTYLYESGPFFMHNYQISRKGTFEEMESRTIDSEKELGIVNMIRRVVLAENVPTEKKTVHHIEREIITCQYCHKKENTADRCRLINRFQENKNQNYSPNNTDSLNKSNNDNNFNQVNQTTTLNTQTTQNQSNTNITCRYCKKFGHSIEECRKRMYNNNLRQNST